MTDKPTESTREIHQTRYYSNKTMMQVDIDQLKNYPSALELKQPPMRNFHVKLKKINSIEIFEGKPPVTKHQMNLTLLMEGTDKNLEAWSREADAFHSIKTTVSASEQLREVLKNKA